MSVKRDFVLQIKDHHSKNHTHTIGGRTIQFRAGRATILNADDRLIAEIKKLSETMWDIVGGKLPKQILSSAQEVKARKLKEAEALAQKDVDMVESRKVLKLKENAELLAKSKGDTDTEKEDNTAEIDQMVESTSKKELMGMLDDMKLSYDPKANKTALATIILNN